MPYSPPFSGTSRTRYSRRGASYLANLVEHSPGQRTEGFVTLLGKHLLRVTCPEGGRQDVCEDHRGQQQLGDYPGPDAGREHPPPPYTVQRTGSRQVARAPTRHRLLVVGFRYGRVKREERCQPPDLRPGEPHYSGTASREARSPIWCFPRLVEMVLQSSLIAPRPRVILSPLYRDNCRANPAPQPLLGDYHTFGRTNSSFRRIRSSTPRERIHLFPLRLYKEERDKEVGGLGGDGGGGARHPNPGAGERDGDGAMKRLDIRPTSTAPTP
jgi:hypothetical protein